MVKYLCLYNGAKQTVYNYSMERTAGRAIDQLTIEVPRSKTVDINDEVYLTISQLDLSDLSGLYNLDADAKDWTENANNGTASNVTWEGGAHNKQAIFNGTSSVITIPHHAANNFGTSSFSLLTETITSASGDYTLIDKYGNSGWSIRVSSGKVKLYVKNSGGTEFTYTSVGTSINDGDVHHIMVVREYGVAWRIYIDGLLTDNVTNGATLPNNVDHNIVTDVKLGYSPSLGGYYTGILDQFFFFKRILTADEAIFGSLADHSHPLTAFGGYVIDREYKIDRIMVKCESFGRVIRDKFIESTKYYDKTVEYIIEDLIETAGTGNPSNGTGLTYDSTWVSGITLKEYVAFGQLIDILTELSKSVSVDFKVTYNKLFYFEPNPDVELLWTGEVGTNLVSKAWLIKDSEIINVVYVLGGSKKYQNTEEFTADGVASEFEILYAPTSINVFLDVTGVGNAYVRQEPGIDYDVDREGKTVTFDVVPGAADKVKIEYEYDQPVFLKTEDVTSKAQYGERAKKFNAEWITNIDDARRYANGLLNFYKQPRLSGTLVYPNIKTEIRELARLRVVDSYAKPQVDQIMEIKSVKWKYPDGITEFEVGTWVPRVFEWQKDIILRLRDLERRAAAVNELIRFLQLPEEVNAWTNNVTVTAYNSNDFRISEDVDVYLPFEQNLNNLGLNGDSGTFNGGSPSYVSGGRRYGIYFDGVNDYINGANNIGISGDAAFTIAFWVYWDDATWSTGFPSAVGNNSTGVTNQGLSVTFKDGRPALDFWSNRWRATNALTVRTKYHIVVTKSAGVIGSTSKIYVNGVEVAGAVEGSNTTPNITDSTYIVGRLDATRWFKGWVDEVKIYKNRTASATQAMNLYLYGTMVEQPFEISIGDLAT